MFQPFSQADSSMTPEVRWNRTGPDDQQTVGGIAWRRYRHHQFAWPGKHLQCDDEPGAAGGSQIVESPLELAVRTGRPAEIAASAIRLDCRICWPKTARTTSG